jgi:hypothetical protein
VAGRPALSSSARLRLSQAASVSPQASPASMALSPSVAARLRHITAALAPTGTADSSPPAASADATTIVSASTASAVAAAAPEPACLDYAYSFITNPGPLNAVRFCKLTHTAHPHPNEENPGTAGLNGLRGHYTCHTQWHPVPETLKP